MSAEDILGLLIFFFVVVPFCVGAGFIIRLVMKRRAQLRKEHILERWEVLIEGGNGSAEDIFDSVTAVLESAEAPHVKWERKKILAGGLLTGVNYNGIIVSNSALMGCKIYVIAYDYGKGLHTAWFLTMQPGFWDKAIASAILKVSDPRALVRYFDIPHELELSAYVTTVHSGMKKAIGTLMAKLEQDFSKVDTKSKGFLEIW